MKLSIRLQNHGCANHPYWYFSAHQGGLSLLPIAKIFGAASSNMSATGLPGKELLLTGRSLSIYHASNIGLGTGQYLHSKFKNFFHSGTSCQNPFRFLVSSVLFKDKKR